MALISRKVKVLIENVASIPWKLKRGVALSAILQSAHIEKYAIIYGKVKFYRSMIGSYSYVGQSSFVSDTKIGKFTSISQECYIGGAAHPINWIGTSLHFYCTQKNEEGTGRYFPKHYYDTFKRTYIGNDVWIGARVVILAGIVIADGAVIGAGSVVTKDVGPYEIWAGNPARLIRKRFDEDKINKLLQIQWWSANNKKWEYVAKHVSDVDEFIKAWGENNEK